MSIAASVTSVDDALDFGLRQVADLDLGIDLEGRVEGDLALGRLRFSVMRGGAGDAQLGLVDGLARRPRPTLSFSTS